MALRFCADAGLLPKEPRTPGHRVLYARDLMILRDGLASRLEGALIAMRQA